MYLEKVLVSNSKNHFSVDFLLKLCMLEKMSLISMYELKLYIVGMTKKYFMILLNILLIL